MADYKRLVSYIYNYEAGIRNKNIGFSRVESKKGQCKVTIHITASLSTTEPLKVYLFHRNGSEIEGILLGKMTIKNGTGDFRVETATKSLMDTDYGLDDIDGVLIILNENKFFELAKQKGFEAADVYFSRNYSLSMSVFRGQVDSFTQNDNYILTARGIVNGKFGTVTTETIETTEAIETNDIETIEEWLYVW